MTYFGPKTKGQPTREREPTAEILWYSALTHREGPEFVPPEETVALLLGGCYATFDAFHSEVEYDVDYWNGAEWVTKENESVGVVPGYSSRPFANGQEAWEWIHAHPIPPRR